MHLRKAFGEDILSKGLIVEAAKSDKDIVVVDGVRRLPDIMQMQASEGFYFIYVEASPEKRYERLTQRHQNSDDAGKTLAQFEKDALLEAESQIRDLKEHADFVVNNDGTLEELQKQIDDIVAQIRK